MTIGALDDAVPADRPRPFNRRGWISLGVAILCEVTGSLSLRGALDQPALYAVVVLAYLTAFACLAQTLRTGFGIGMAYGIWGACGVALTALGSAGLFQEVISPVMGAGIVLVILGVICIEMGGRRS